MQTRSQSKFLRHESCDNCGSSDGKAVYEDGTGYCFVCQTYHKADSADNASVGAKVYTMTNKAVVEPVNASQRHFRSIPDRGISKATCEAYGVTQTDTDHYYPYTDAKGNDIAYKVRSVEDKKFVSKGNIKDAQLFGQALWNGGGKFVTVVEGELDALAAYQMMGSKYPVVSIKNGAQSAVKDCQAQYEWLDSFDTIVLAFDADEPGTEAAGKVAELFGNKVKIVKFAKGYKDACDYLKDNKSAEFVKAWWAAENYVPDGIVAGAELFDLVMQPLVKAQAHYPYAGLNAMTGGIRQQEMVVVTAGSGLGKSQFMREVIWQLLCETQDNIGIMFLEESVKRTALSLMSLAINKPLHLAEVEANDREKKEAFDKTLGSNRLFFYDCFGSTAIDNIINRVRYFAKGLDCKYILLDHVSIVVSAQDHGDERKAIDEIMTKLRMIVQETGISLFVVSHLKRPDGGRGHEEGAATSLSQLRGSGSIGQLADMVLGLERAAQHEDPVERNTTRIRIIKNRYSGETGKAAAVLYDKYTGRMNEINETSL
jgi:twinkle protein